LTPERESREHLAELEPDLRERILLLDEPVAWDDWSDVVARQSRTSRRATRRRAGFGAAFAAAVLAVSALVSLAGVRVQLGGSDASEAVEGDFSQFALSVPPSISTQAIASQTRLITSVRTRTGTHTLYVSPMVRGGFCYQWTGDGSGGCAALGRSPLDVSWGTGRLVGVVSSASVSSIEVSFTDGTTAKPRLAWVGAPIDAGFVFYEIPAGKTVAGVIAYDEGRTQGQVTWYSV
jgi:hypothetical protein